MSMNRALLLLACCVFTLSYAIDEEYGAAFHVNNDVVGGSGSMHVYSKLTSAMFVSSITLYLHSGFTVKSCTLQTISGSSSPGTLLVQPSEDVKLTKTELSFEPLEIVDVDLHCTAQNPSVSTGSKEGYIMINEMDKKKFITVPIVKDVYNNNMKRRVFGTLVSSVWSTSGAGCVSEKAEIKEEQANVNIALAAPEEEEEKYTYTGEVLLHMTVPVKSQQSVSRGDILRVDQPSYTKVDDRTVCSLYDNDSLQITVSHTESFRHSIYVHVDGVPANFLIHCAGLRSFHVAPHSTPIHAKVYLLRSDTTSWNNQAVLQYSKRARAVEPARSAEEQFARARAKNQPTPLRAQLSNVDVLTSIAYNTLDKSLVLRISDVVKTKQVYIHVEVSKETTPVCSNALLYISGSHLRIAVTPGYTSIRCTGVTLHDQDRNQQLISAIVDDGTHITVHSTHQYASCNTACLSSTYILEDTTLNIQLEGLQSQMNDQVRILHTNNKIAFLPTSHCIDTAGNSVAISTASKEYTALTLPASTGFVNITCTDQSQLTFPDVIDATLESIGSIALQYITGQSVSCASLALMETSVDNMKLSSYSLMSSVYRAEKAFNTGVTIYLSPYADMMANSLGTVVASIEPIPRAITSGSTISLRFPSDSYFMYTSQQVGYSNATQCEISSGVSASVGTTIRTVSTDSIVMTTNRNIALSDGFIKVICWPVLVPSYQVVVGSNLGQTLFKLLDPNGAKIMEQVSEQFHSTKMITAGELTETRTAILSDGSLVALFQVPYAMNMGDVVRLTYDKVWFSSNTLSCDVTDNFASYTYVQKDTKAVLSVTLPRGIPISDPLQYVRCRNIQIPLTTNGLELATIEILKSGTQNIKAKSTRLEMPNQTNVMAAAQHEFVMYEYKSGKYTNGTVLLNRFPVKVAIDQILEVTLPIEYQFHTNNVCTMEQRFQVDPSEARLAEITTSKNVIRVIVKQALVEYPVVTAIMCTSVVAHVGSGERKDVTTKLFLSNAVQYQATTGKILEIFSGTVGAISHNGQLTNTKAGEESDQRMIIQPIGAILDTGDIMIIEFGSEFTQTEGGYCSVYAYNDASNVMGAGSDKEVRIATTTLRDPISNSRFAQNFTETGTRQLELLKLSLTYATIDCSTITNPPYETSSFSMATFRILSNQYSRTAGPLYQVTAASLFTGNYKYKASAGWSMLGMVQPNLLGGITKRLYQFPPHIATTGMLVAIINPTRNIVQGSSKGGSLRQTLPETWQFSAAGYTSVCSARVYHTQTRSDETGIQKATSLVSTISGSTSITTDYNFRTLRFKPSEVMKPGRIILQCTNVRTPIEVSSEVSELTIATYKDENIVDIATDVYLPPVTNPMDQNFNTKLSFVHYLTVLRSIAFNSAEVKLLEAIYSEMVAGSFSTIDVVSQSVMEAQYYKAPTVIFDSSAAALNMETQGMPSKPMQTMQTSVDQVYFTGDISKVFTDTRIQYQKVRVRSPSTYLTQPEMIDMLNSTSSRSLFKTKLESILDVSPVYKMTITNPGSRNCENGIKDEGESDIDCGGACKKCGVWKTCQQAADCYNNRCVNNKCEPTPTSYNTATKTDTYSYLMSIMVILISIMCYVYIQQPQRL